MEQVAVRAQARGAYASAAKALEQAARLSADPRARTFRLVGAARAASTAGADEHALAYANEALPLAENPDQRADLALVFGLAAIRGGRPADVVPMLMEAARGVAALDGGKAIDLLLFALSAASGSGDDAVLGEAAAAAADVVPPPGDEKAAVVQMFIRGFAAERDGDAALTVSVLRPAIELAAVSDDTYAVFIGSVGAVVVGDDATYDALLGRAVSMGRARGELGLLSEAIALRAVQLATVQRYDEAAHAAMDALQFGREVRAPNHMLMPRAVLAVVAAVHGEADEARRRADEVLRVAKAHTLVVRGALAVYALALLDVTDGRWGDALDKLQSIATINSTVSMRVALDRVEAAVRADRLDEARAALDEFESWGAQTQAAWAAPSIAACGGLLTKGTEATARFAEALHLVDGARPFDRARIQLFYGEHLRRERRRADARVQLRVALDGFERLRATPWVERAASELRATGETARKRDPSNFDQLTPQEIQISRLVAAGMSNKEVGAQLYLSPRTIDYHLRNVFAKLGLTSRTQLAHVPLGDDAPDAAEEAARATG
jgi:DNA-binding CsgD family transcriptional regulator